MFKAKVYLYKNINWVEVKVEKEFDNQDKYNEYIEKNPDLKKLESNFEKIEFPKSFDEMRKYFEDIDKKIFWDMKKRNLFFDEISDDFKKLFDKSKNLLEK